MPDGGLFPQRRRRRQAAEDEPLVNPERGVVEIKPAEYRLDALMMEPQTLRYLQRYGLVLITNLREFRLLQLTPVGRPEALESYTIASTVASLWFDPLPSFGRHSDLLLDFLRRVMLYRAPLVQPKDVAWLLASYAREARARAEDHPLASFDAVRTALQESLGIRFEGERGEHFFRSTLVQTLFYGIFSAWILWRRAPEARGLATPFDWRVAAHYLRVPVLRKLFGEVADPGAVNSLQLHEILNLAGEALNRVEDAFFEIFEEEEAVAYFYEPFLEAFDPQLRKDLGVWYTPKEIVRYMVERVDYLLRAELGQPLGLASPSVRILDPCCGTGAYLTAVLERIHRTLLTEAGDDAALVPNELRTAALNRVFGFEIMPAPFVIAHLQLSALLESAGASLGDSQRAGVYLTNALTGWVPERHPQSVIFEEFQREREHSEDIKQRGTILVIIGNPPYNGYAGIAQIAEERDLTRAYRTRVPGLPMPQGNGLNNLYIRFFRVAERRICANPAGTGVISFISAYSWLDGLSHPAMRHRLIHEFDKIYVDNLHGDRKISEYAPDGQTSETVFAVPGTSPGIKVGTAISTLVRTSDRTNRRIEYRDFTEAKASSRRASLLTSLSSYKPHYSLLTPESALGLPLKPRDLSANYAQWPSLTDLFVKSYPCIKTSRDPLVIDTDYERLESRMRDYLGTAAKEEEITATTRCAMQSTPRFDAAETRRILQKKGFKPWQIVRHLYRPFDVRWLYWEPETKLLDEKREDFVGQMAPHELAIILPRQNRVTVDGPLVAHGFVDLNAADGGAKAFPGSVVSDGALTYGEVLCNARQPLASFLQTNRVSMSDFLSHTVATLHAPAYRSENRGPLLRDWPHIPLPRNSDSIAKSAALGRRLVDVLDADSHLSFAAEWLFMGALRFPANTDVDEALKISAGWGRRGQGDAINPGTGMSETREWTPVERDKLVNLARTVSLSTEAALDLLGRECIDVYLNTDSSWTAIPSMVWSYTLGGYQVLKKWLSYRESVLLGRSLRAGESQYFGQVVRRIAAILLAGPSLDANYADVLQAPGTL